MEKTIQELKELTKKLRERRRELKRSIRKLKLSKKNERLLYSLTEHNVDIETLQFLYAIIVSELIRLEDWIDVIEEISK